MFKFLACIVLFLAVAFGTNVALANDVDFGRVTGGQVNEAIEKTTPVHFLPPNPVYYLVRVKELVLRFFTPSAKERAQFDFVISSKRLKEGYLLINKGSIGRGASSFNSYIHSLERTKSQLTKARGQNQDIMPDIDQMANGLQYQEIILASVSEKIDSKIYTNMVEEFEDFVKYLDKLKPGLISRYKILGEEEKNNKQKDALPSPTPTLRPESTSSSNPRRIIF